MSEREEAERFTEALDLLLDGAATPGRGQTSGEHARLLNLAQSLLREDLSSESAVRADLRASLLAKAGRERAASARRRVPAFGRLTRPAVIAIAVFVALAAMALARPGTLTAAARGLEGFVLSLVLGENLAVRNVDGAPEESVSFEDPVEDFFGDDSVTVWIAKTTVGERPDSFGSPRSPGAPQTFASFEEAQERVGFPVVRPGWLPAGYSLRSVMVSAPGWIIARFDGPGGPLLLAEAPLGDSNGGTATAGADTSIDVLTDRPIQPVQVNGGPAAWVEGRSLSWSTGAVSLTLALKDLPLDKAIRMAESIR